VKSIERQLRISKLTNRHRYSMAQRTALENDTLENGRWHTVKNYKNFFKLLIK